MPAIAIIGADGAGKTTITRLLLESSALPFKYVYMGINFEASNIALPTTRLAAYLKRLWARNSHSTRSVSVATPARKHVNRKRFHALLAILYAMRATGRVVNLLAEEWYRQLMSWCYQLRGYIVLYDRHFVFDFSLIAEDVQELTFSKWFHCWCIAHFYPRPDLVICLDAPADVLFARKREWDEHYLETRRQALLCQGAQASNFVQIDVTQPLDMVYTEVLNHILRYHEGARNR